MSIYKKESGLIFEDNFNTLDSRWTISPNNSCSIIGGNLRINHNSSGETIALFELPDELNLLFEVTATYLPTLNYDRGGIVVYRNAFNKLEFLEDKDSKSYEYTIWRAVKSGNTWTFYAKHGGVWEYFDSSVFNATMAGIVLRGVTTTGFQPILVDKVVLCRSKSITIGNLDEGYQVDLCNALGTVELTATVGALMTGVIIDLPTIPFNGILKVYNTGGVLLDTYGALELYGGDCFMQGDALEILRGGVGLSVLDFNYLGQMHNNRIEEQLELKNNTSASVSDATVSVTQYLTETGYGMVDIAEDSGGVPALYTDTVNLGTLAAGDSAYFWIKVFKPNTDYYLLEPAKFALDVYHS